MKYKFIDEIKSDVMYEAYGKDPKELFENAAEALFSVICKIKEVQPKQAEEIQIKGENLEELMYNWLQALIALVDTEQKFYSKFIIEDISETKLKAAVSGEPIQPGLGDTLVKAVTYHRFKLEQTENGYKAIISLDI